MKGAQHCRDCGGKMRVADVGQGGGKTFRELMCDKCEKGWETVEDCGRSLQWAPTRSNPLQGVARESNGPPPVATGAPQTLGGVGGGVSEVPICPDSDPNSSAIFLSNPDQTRAKSKGAAIDYQPSFLILWEQTGRRGVKAKAHEVWLKMGRPSWVDVQATWRAYLLSERPVAGFVKDLSSWLNGRCHQQEWVPVKPGGVDLRCRFHRLPNTRGKIPDRAPPLEGCPECKHARAANGTRQGSPTPISDTLPTWMGEQATADELAGLRKANNG